MLIFSTAFWKLRNRQSSSLQVLKDHLCLEISSKWKYSPFAFTPSQPRAFSTTKYSSSVSTFVFFVLFLSHLLQWRLLETIPYHRFEELWSAISELLQPLTSGLQPSGPPAWATSKGSDLKVLFLFYFYEWKCNLFSNDETPKSQIFTVIYCHPWHR